MTTDFASIAQRIESNPLGRLMYGQRELFHSNLLAWFFDALPAAADEVFTALSQTGPGSERQVEREKENLDLVMRWPGYDPLVIENKVFSIPTQAQLKTYSDKLSRWGEDSVTVLLAPSRPRFPLGDWRFVSYRNLADSIESSLSLLGASYEAETMRRYALLARDLSDLVEAVDVRSVDESVWLPERLLRAISSNQMRAALQKARASRVAAIINEDLGDDDGAVGSNMTRATPLVESFELVNTGELRVLLGWQLQGNQFRRRAIYKDDAICGRDDASKSERERISNEHPEFFTFPPALPGVRGGRSEFNHFAPDSVYQWVKVSNLSVRDLMSAARTIHDEVASLH